MWLHVGSSGIIWHHLGSSGVISERIRDHFEETPGRRHLRRGIMEDSGMGSRKFLGGNCRPLLPSHAPGINAGVDLHGVAPVRNICFKKSFKLQCDNGF